MIWPVVARPAVELPALPGLDLDLWDTMIALADALPGQWTLIGGQMVLLHALEHGVPATRVSTDLDALVNVRAVVGSLPAFVEALHAMGFQVDGISTEGIAHRYRRDRLSVDVLAPDGLGSAADLRTRPPSPARTLQVPGGTQALHRTELLPVVAGGRMGCVPRPSLVGAIVGKATAVDIDDVPEAQRQDLVLLLSLVDDPFAIAEQLSRKDRQRLRTRHELLDRQHRAWRTLDDGAADRGHAALVVLVRDPLDRSGDGGQRPRHRGGGHPRRPHVTTAPCRRLGTQVSHFSSRRRSPADSGAAPRSPGNGSPPVESTVE